jgi:hypothetical protein
MRQVAKYYAILGKQTFSPLDLSPALWLDASDTATITASSGSVSQWNDKSGNGRNVTQGTAAAQPTTAAATLNGLNVLSFDGEDNLVSSATWTLAQPMTVVVVFTTGAIQAQYSILWDGSRVATGTRALMHARNADFASESTMYATTNVVTGALSPSTNYAWAAIFNGASSVSRRNGVSTNLASNPGTAGIINGIMLSGAISTTRFTGTIAEVIVVGSALSAQQQSDLSTYTSSKWGVTL